MMRQLNTITGKHLSADKSSAHWMKALSHGLYALRSLYTMVVALLLLGFSLNAQAVATTTTLTTSVATVVAGTNMTLTASVAGLTPTGNVVFKDGATIIGTVATTGTTATRTAVLTTNFTTIGAHSITAEYAGDADDTASISTAKTVTATIRTSTTTLAAAPTTAAVGANVVLTATIVGVLPTGSVTFKDGATIIGTGTLSQTGTSTTNATATLTTTFSTVAAHSMTAVYAGDSNNTTSTSVAVAVTVTKATPTNVVTSSLTTAAVGQSVVLTATITGYQPTAPAATSVIFKDGTVTIAGTPTYTPNGNVLTATLSTTFSTAAAHSITAVYATDPKNNAVTSAARVVTVVPAPTSTTLATNVTTIAAGVNMTLTATVVGIDPTGNVQFKDGGTNIGVAIATTGTGTSRTATLTTASFTTAGVHNITAVYVGDANDATSTSAASTVTVTNASTTNTLTTSVATVVAGTNMTFTATIVGINPTGTVTFKDNGTPIGTGTLASTVANSKAATLTASLSTVGVRSITAEYAGDANNNTSISTAKTVTVTIRTSTTTLAAAPTTAAVGANVVLTATIVGVLPTGSVTFKDGATIIGTGTLSQTGTSTTNATATLTTTYSTVAAHSMTAVYAGDSNNTTSTSVAVAVTVTKATPTNVVTTSLSTAAVGQSVLLTATITGYQPTAPAATSVIFKDGTVTIAGTPTYTINGNVLTATLSASFTTVAAHSITAVYATDPKNNAVTSAAKVVTVGTTAITSTTLTAPSTGVVGRNTALSASVTGFTPTGTVTFKDGAATLGTSTLVGTGSTTTATFNAIFTSTGTHSITAVYAGDANDATSTSSASTVIVYAAPTVSISAPVNNANYAVPANIQLIASASDSDGSISNVKFYEGANLIGTASRQGSTNNYVFNWNNVPLGSFQVTAVATDSQNISSTSAVITVTVTTAATQVYYIHTDQLGTPRLITNSANAKVWEWNNDDPFANNVPNENPSNLGTFTYNPRLPGQYFDSETNTHYNYYRDYDPATGRYIESDPIGLEGGINTYSYVENDPLSYVDPEGLAGEIPNPNGVVPGGTWEPRSGARPGSFQGPKQPKGGRALCEYVPDEKNGGPKGAREPYWKTKSDGQKGWQRYSSSGSPITPEAAHSNPRAAPPFRPSPAGAAGALGAGLMLYSPSTGCAAVHGC